MDDSGQHLLEILGRSWRTGALGCWLASIFLLGCGTLTAPVEFDVSSTPEPSERSLVVEPVEGRPEGLLLRLRATGVPKEARRLQLLRAIGDQPAQLHRDVELNEQTRRALQTDGIEYLERSVGSEPETLRFQLRLAGEERDEPLAQSKICRIQWKAPPPRPTKLDGESRLTGTVELRWAASAKGGAIVFRRNVTREGASVKRLAQVPPSASGVYVDRSATPGDVYAYRVALAAKSGELTQYGRTSEPVYVVVEEDDGLQPSTSSK